MFEWWFFVWGIEIIGCLVHVICWYDDEEEDGSRYLNGEQIRLKICRVMDYVPIVDRLSEKCIN